VDDLDVRETYILRTIQLMKLNLMLLLEKRRNQQFSIKPYLKW